MNNSLLVKKIAKKLNVKVIDVEKIPNYYKTVNMPSCTFINKSYLYGNNEIVIGKYKNKEMKLASFFHEVGHTLVENSYMKAIDYSKYLIESAAWYLGIQMASEYGISFSKPTTEWIVKNIETYKK